MSVLAPEDHVDLLTVRCLVVLEHERRDACTGSIEFNEVEVCFEVEFLCCNRLSDRLDGIADLFDFGFGYLSLGSLCDCFLGLVCCCCSILIAGREKAGLEHHGDHDDHHYEDNCQKGFLVHH